MPLITIRYGPAAIWTKIRSGRPTGRRTGSAAPKSGDEALRPTVLQGRLPFRFPPVFVGIHWWTTSACSGPTCSSELQQVARPSASVTKTPRPASAPTRSGTG